jgi:hypothetical protein
MILRNHYNIRIPLLLLALAFLAQSADIVRERNEATYNCNASNVAGSGNIMLFGQFDGFVGHNQAGIIPIAGGQLGIGGIMQFSARASFPGFNSIGLAQAHLQITTPGNDRLRPFGVGLIGDLYLSTAFDTIAKTADATKPDYNPYLRASIVGDIDWLSFINWLPLKTYIEMSLADDPELLYRYDQLSGKVGVEWKMFQHSIFCDVGTGFYMENNNQINSNPGHVADNGFKQYYGWVAPGGRYRLFKRFSIVGGTRFLIFQHLKSVNPLEPTYFSVSVKAEAPLYYRETNTEAIRTLVFMEREKAMKQQIAVTTKTGAVPKDYAGEFGVSLGGLGDSTQILRDQEDKEAIKRREMVQKKMDEIEKMLKETE